MKYIVVDAYRRPKKGFNFFHEARHFIMTRSKIDWNKNRFEWSIIKLK